MPKPVNKPSRKQAAAKAAPKSAKPAADRQLPGAFSLFWPSKDAVMSNFPTLLFLWFIPTLFLSTALPVFDNSHPASRHNFSLIYHGTQLNGVAVGLFSLAMAILWLYIAPALTYAQIQSTRDKKVRLSEAFKQTKDVVIRYFLSTVLVGLIVVGGLLLFIVPGVLWFKKYFFTQYYVVDKKMPVRQALRASAQTTAGQAYSIYGIVLVSAVFSLSALIPITGRLISLILGFLYSCAIAIRYDQLKNS